VAGAAGDTRLRPNPVKAEKAVLFFESTKTTKNASGDPIADSIKSGKAITVKGEIVSVPTN
jgi:hypothetical protein